MSATWTIEEIEYLRESWGTVSVYGICKKLNRTKEAVLLKVSRLGLGPFLQNGDYITFCQLVKCVTGAVHSYSDQYKSWIENRHLPVFKKRIDEAMVRVIRIDDFWLWAEKNQGFLDFSRFEENILGAEPEWVKRKRKNDMDRNRSIISTPWTREEDRKLIFLLKQHKYTYAQVQELTRRSAGAILRRCIDLGIPDRPLKQRQKKWTHEEKMLVFRILQDGGNYEMAARKVDRSTSAVRGLCYRKYRTENLDKLRSRMKGVPADV